jgi:hypothetical protein
MYKDYADSIVATYRHLKMKNTLSSRLARPSPAKIKEECKQVCNKRYSKKDDEIIYTFFEQVGDKKLIIKAIEGSAIDKFRPLVNYLKDKTSDPVEKNIELLAWLIDYKRRPFKLGETYVPQIDETDKQTPLPDKLKWWERLLQQINDLITGTRNAKPGRKAIIAGVVFVAMAAPGYLMWKNKSLSSALERHESCMYWTGDHYERISCNQKIPGVVPIALDTEKLNSFKRITRPDTITYWSVGKVWYIKRNKKLEYFTAPGSDPNDPTARLSPISVHIIKTHLRPE